jgi:hypothetical protein
MRPISTMRRASATYDLVVRIAKNPCFRRLLEDLAAFGRIMGGLWEDYGRFFVSNYSMVSMVYCQCEDMGGILTRVYMRAHRAHVSPHCSKPSQAPISSHTL